MFSNCWRLYSWLKFYIHCILTSMKVVSFVIIQHLLIYIYCDTVDNLYRRFRRPKAPKYFSRHKWNQTIKTEVSQIFDTHLTKSERWNHISWNFHLLDTWQFGVPTLYRMLLYRKQYLVEDSPLDYLWCIYSYHIVWSSLMHYMILPLKMSIWNAKNNSVYMFCVKNG